VLLPGHGGELRADRLLTYYFRYLRWAGSLYKVFGGAV